MKSILPTTILALLLLCSFTITLPYLNMEDSRDGNNYGIVKIRDMHIMTNNLRFDSESASCYEHRESYCDHYGNLYHMRGYEVEVKEGDKKFCPKGWHVPTVEEWEYLLRGMNPKVSYDTNRNYKYELVHNYARLQFGGFKSHASDKYFQMSKAGHYFTSSKTKEGEWITVVVRRNADDNYEVTFNEKTPMSRGVSCRCVKGDIEDVVGTKK